LIYQGGESDCQLSVSASCDLPTVQEPTPTPYERARPFDDLMLIYASMHYRIVQRYDNQAEVSDFGSFVRIARCHALMLMTGWPGTAIVAATCCALGRAVLKCGSSPQRRSFVRV